jgi:hypothetical protein
MDKACNQVFCESAAGDNTTTLTPIKSKGGIKLLVVSIDGHSALVVESRRKLVRIKTSRSKAQ